MIITETKNNVAHIQLEGRIMKVYPTGTALTFMSDPDSKDEHVYTILFAKNIDKQKVQVEEALKLMADGKNVKLNVSMNIQDSVYRPYAPVFFRSFEEIN